VASILTLDGPPAESRRDGRDARDTPRVGDCKRVWNPRTKRHAELCYVGKARSRTGWQFTKSKSR